MKKIPLNHGMHTLVDDADFDWLNQWKWTAERKGYTFYAVRGVGPLGKSKLIHMHREIVDTPFELETDHKDGDGLNNQRNNLRICTRSQNNMNRRKRPHCSSIYKGVGWDSAKCKWSAKVCISGKTINLGRYKKEVDAAIAYNNKAIELFGEFARVNQVTI